MLRRALWLTAVVVLIAAISTAAVQAMEFKYNGNVAPNIANSAGPGYSFIPESQLSASGVVPAAGATDGLAWYILDDVIDGAEFWRITPAVDISHLLGATILGRMKVVSDTHGVDGERADNLGIIDSNTGMHTRAHYGGVGNDIGETRRGIFDSITGDDGWHVVRATVKGRIYGSVQAPWSDNFDSYPDSVDPNAEPDPDVNGLPGNGIWFGDAHSDLYCDNQSITVRHWPGNGYRGAGARVLASDNGSLEFTCKVKAGVNGGTDGFFWRLYVEDPDGTELASWYGTSDTVYPRSPAGPLSGQLLSGGWDTLKIHLNTTTSVAEFFYTPEGGSQTSLGTLGMSGADPEIGIVYLEVWDRGEDVSTGNTILFDDFEVAGGEVTEALREINFYLDESPTPVFTIYPAEAAAGSNEQFAFGSGSGAAQQEIYFDWVSGTDEGAFAPGEEVATLGHSLVVTDTSTAITTLDLAKVVPDDTPVSLTDAIVTARFIDDDYAVCGFGVEQVGRQLGMRVVKTILFYDAPAAGDRVDIIGVTDTINGERVIVASSVTNKLSPLVPPLTPVALTNKASGGAAFGEQMGVIDNMTATTPFTIFADSFTYDDGALNGNGPWHGDATETGVAVEGNWVRCNGDAPNAEAIAPVDPIALTATGYYTVRCKIQKTMLTDPGNFWSLWIDDAAGLNLARWYGTAFSAKPRMGGSGQVLDAATLTGGEDILEVKITPGADTSEFFFNGAPLGTLYHTTTGAGDLLGRVMFKNQSQLHVGANILFDDLSVTCNADPAEGLSNIGLFTKIFGKVTKVENTYGYAGYFYVDDGSGLKDNSGFVGIKCRPPSFSNAGDLPTEGQTVEVTGVIGIANGARYFWTDKWEAAP